MNCRGNLFVNNKLHALKLTFDDLGIFFQIFEMYPKSKTSEYVMTADVPVETLLVDGPGRKVPPAPEDEFEGDDDDEAGLLLFHNINC